MPEPICTDTDLLAALNSRENLFAFLRNKLAWAIDPEDTFTYDDPAAAGRAAAHADLSQILPFSAGDPFLIFLVEFREKFRRGDLREILRGVRKRIREQAAYRNAALDEMVFVCTLPDGLRFVHFEEREGRQPRMRVFGFDRQTVGETFTLRTVNLPLLCLTTNLMGEVDWTACRKNWQDAWNVEKVTKKFFEDYREVFKDVETKYVHDAPGNSRLFVQRFFNRLMFLHFLSKKGWLRAPGKSTADSGREYLLDLWKTYKVRDKSKDGPGVTFYGKHLSLLFFAALNQPHVTRQNPMLLELVGDVPYLNGGLFEETDDDRASFKIDDAAFLAIWERLFSCYNFTVAESTPDDQDVAVDPEMLGKVFEELVTGRHESGSYYTPRPIVQFMCREALKGYLAPHGAGIERFVDFHDAREITRHEDVLAALRSVKVVDPACGSGAYLLGMLQELMALRLALFNAKRLDDESTYRRKLEIIQNSIYGVDLDLFAVNTARLRLWLSLVVESDRNPLNDTSVSVALPNLDFKIEQGDSVSCPDPQNLPTQVSTRTELIRQFEAKKRVHSDVNFHGNKADLKAEIDQLRREISEETPGSSTDFDWRVDFGEVFQPKFAVADIGGAMNFGGTLAPPPEPGGFDIVLANPPYVRADAQFKHLAPDEAARQAAIEEWKAYRLALKKSKIYSTLHEKWDLYIPFLERAFQLLRPDGHMIFIIPDAVNANKYATAARDFFMEHSRVIRIDFCSEMDIFDAGVSNTILHFSKGRPSPTHVPVLARRFAANREEFDKFVTLLPTKPQAEFGTTLFRQAGESNHPTIVDFLPLEILFYISKGMVLHSEDPSGEVKFTKDDLISPTRDAEHTKRFAEGKHLLRWVIGKTFYLEYGTDRSPVLCSRPVFPELFEVPEKLISMDISGSGIRVSFDGDKTFHNHSAWSFVPWHYLKGVRNNSIRKTANYRKEITGHSAISIAREDLEEASALFEIRFLLGIMNSETTRLWISRQRRSNLHVYPDDWKQLPIPTASAEEQAVIASLVQQCIDRRGQDVAELEAEINERVAALYGL